MLRRICCVWVVLAAAVAQASEPVATSQLPAGLAAIGVSATDAISQAEAASIRGSSGTLVLQQEKNFTISGVTLAAGSTVNLLEGIIGQITVSTTTVDGDSTTTTTIEALFGGLSGNVSVTNGVLNFDLAGKTLQETLNLQGGQFTQDFTQWYKAYR